jgi:hypothetical protein
MTEFNLKIVYLLKWNCVPFGALGSTVYKRKKPNLPIKGFQKETYGVIYFLLESSFDIPKGFFP